MTGRFVQSAAMEGVFDTQKEGSVGQIVQITAIEGET
jgi:hypothetical protein